MKKISLVIATVLILGACTSNETAPQQSINNNGAYETAPQNMLGDLPSWALNPYVEGAESAIGMVKAGASGVQNARNKAIFLARTELANQMEIKVQTMAKNYMSVVGQGENERVENVFIEASRQVSKQTISGSRQVDLFLTQDNDLYVLVAVPNDVVIEAVKDAMDDGIEQLKDEEKLYQEFKADQAQKDLDIIIEKEFNQNQGA